MKWLRAIKDLVKDVLVFLRVRREQQQMYSPIIDDLETINALATALNDQIRKFSQKWDLFPETQELMKYYKAYYEETQLVYRVTRKGILNNLFAERNKKTIEDNSESLQVHRQDDDQEEKEETDWSLVVQVLEQKNPLLGKILRVCDKVKSGSVVYIQVTRKSKMFLDILLKYKKEIETHCSGIFHENVTVEITEASEE